MSSEASGDVPEAHLMHPERQNRGVAKYEASEISGIGLGFGLEAAADA